MIEETLSKTTEQAEKLFIGPARTYAGLAIDHAEKLFSVQLDAARAYSEVGLKQLRAALAVKDPKSFQAYVSGQQKAASELGERVKDDAQKVAAMNQEFVAKTQKLAQENAGNVAQTATAAKAK